MPMSKMAKLIAELEAATEGSRELSDRVLTVCGWHQEGKANDPRTHYWSAPDGMIYDWWDDPHARSRVAMRHRPCPTTSIDAALTLVPEGWGWVIGDNGRAHLLEPDWRQVPSDRGLNDCKGNSTTPALALCITALKARQR